MAMQMGALRDALESAGAERSLAAAAAEEMAAYRSDLTGIEASISELRADVTRSISDLRGHVDTSIAELRGDMNRSSTELRGDIDKSSTELRGELHQSIAELRGELGKHTWMLNVILAGLGTIGAGVVALLIKVLV